MLMLKVTLVFLVVADTLSSPVPAKTKEVDPNRILYDQRQEGEWNVRADLKNFVILIIPTQSSTSSPAPSSPSLLDFLVKSVPKKPHHLKRVHPKKSKGGEDAAQETMHFIESKTAPYHVDISRSRNHLAKLHPDATLLNAEEIVIAKSPSISLLKDEAGPAHGIRQARATAFVLTVPRQDDRVGQNIKQEGKSSKDEVTKKKVKNGNKSTLKLLGAENEQCGPGLSRDSSGICRTDKK